VSPRALPSFAAKADGVPRGVYTLDLVHRPARVAVRVYAAQRKPVASGRGASGLAGRPPGGSSSL
jgi:hypothetical protein